MGSRLPFMYKMIREIVSMPRADSGYPHNFMVRSWVFKDDESESDTKTNSRYRVCPLLAWRVHAQSLLSTHHVNTHTHTHTQAHARGGGYAEKNLPSTWNEYLLKTYRNRCMMYSERKYAPKLRQNECKCIKKVRIFFGSPPKICPLVHKWLFPKFQPLTLTRACKLPKLSVAF